jgi:hypothetical protein
MWQGQVDEFAASEEAANNPYTRILQPANRASGYSILRANSTIIANSSAAAKIIGAASSVVNQSAVFG